MLAPYSRQVTRTGMQFDWRAISGPALTTATALIAFLVDRHFVAVPNPAPLFVCIVALAALRQRHRLRHDQRRHCGGRFRAVLPQPPRRRPATTPSDLARMLLLAATAGGTAAHHRAAAAEMGRCVRVGAEASRHRGRGCRRRSIRSTSASCCSIPIPAPNSSTAPSAIISRCPTSRPTASRPSSR